MHLPRASLTSAHSRLSALVASSYPESIILSRIGYLIPNRLSYRACWAGLTSNFAACRRTLAALRPGGARISSTMLRVSAITGVSRWRQQCVWDTKMHQKGIPLSRKCVRNAHPSHEIASKMRTLKQKVDLGPREVAGGWGSKSCTLKQKVRPKHIPLGSKPASKRRKRVPLSKKCVKNTYP